MSYIIYYLENCQLEWIQNFRVGESGVGKKGALVEVNVLKQYAFKVSQSGLLGIMGAGVDSCAQNLWGDSKKEKEKKRLNFFFVAKTFEDYICLKEYRDDPA